MTDDESPGRWRRVWAAFGRALNRGILEKSSYYHTKQFTAGDDGRSAAAGIPSSAVRSLCRFVARQEIKQIAGVEVCERAAQAEVVTGSIVQIFTTGTMVQVIRLARSVPTGTWSGSVSDVRS
jgi:hypothetical protein